jgi:hypothetical protein
MIELLVGVALIVFGLVFIFLKKKKETSAPTLSSEKSKEDDKKKDTNTKPFEPSVKIEDLVAPSNFPSEIVFYFGS